MSTMPWGTMNDWMRLEVEERATPAERRLSAHAARAARRTQSAPVVRTCKPAPVGRPAVARIDCTEAA